jgi:hypothetical protein
MDVELGLPGQFEATGMVAIRDRNGSHLLVTAREEIAPVVVEVLIATTEVDVADDLAVGPVDAVDVAVAPAAWPPVCRPPGQCVP